MKHDTDLDWRTGVAVALVLGIMGLALALAVGAVCILALN
ncbi:hypothetical protein [uncultured Mediterranean phage]|nr:hypothetical protein [uncultured Mediterranean phage]